MSLRSRFVGLGINVPDRVVTNDDLAAQMDTSDEWIQKRTGILERRWGTVEDSTSKFGSKAAAEAMKDAGVEPKDIDLIIAGTLSEDHWFPGIAVQIQKDLQIPAGVPALDIRQQCSSFVYGLSIADAYIRSGQFKNILFIGAEMHSKGLERSTRGRDVTVLFGDGAGAYVIQPTEVKDPEKDSHVYSTHIHADGNYYDELWVPGPGTGWGEWIFTHEQLDRGEQFPQMNGNKKTIQDVDLFLFHQANLRINEMVARELEIPADKVFNTIQKYGNTTAATIPIGAYEARKAGKLKQGDLVAFAFFGGDSSARDYGAFAFGVCEFGGCS
jgi:3-oxoacyl-[acyl-carrier-protein] synthase-3